MNALKEQPCKQGRDSSVSERWRSVATEREQRCGIPGRPRNLGDGDGWRRTSGVPERPGDEVAAPRPSLTGYKVPLVAPPPRPTPSSRPPARP